MRSTGSVSRLIDEIRSGQETAATHLWNRFQRRLMAFARTRLKGASKAVADEEDVVVSAFQSFLQRTRRGKFPNLDNRHDLWSLLVAITARKAMNQIRHQSRAKRSHSSADGRILPTVPLSAVQLASSTPTPEYTAAMNEFLEHLFEILGDGELRRIVLLKLQGYSNQEVAKEIDRSVPTVERRLRLIRETWQSEFDV